MTGMGGNAVLVPVWAWQRLDLRRRWRSLVVLALLVALASGTVMTAAAGARRGGSAMDRLLDRTLPATVGVLPNEPGFDWEPVRRLPGVEALTLSGGQEFRLEGITDASLGSPPADLAGGQTIERPVVLSGRLADATRVDEAVVTPNFLDHNNLELGDTVTALLFTPTEVDQLAEDETVAPTGPRQPLRIVGVARSPLGGLDRPGGTGGLMPTYAFFTAYRANLTGTGTGINVGASTFNAFVRLTGGEAGIPAFERAFVDLTGRDDIEIANYASDNQHTSDAAGFEADFLLAFALAALVAAAVLLGQAVARYTAVSAGDLETLRTLGLTSRQAVVAAVVGPGLAAVVGAAVGAGVAAAASGQFPIGIASYFEPDPGVRADPTVLAGTAAVMVALMVISAAAGAWLALLSKRAVAPPRRSLVAAAAYRLGCPVPVAVGARLALEPGRGRSAVPVRPALVAAVVGVLGVLAALTLRAGVVDALENPARFGQTAQLVGFSGFNGADFGGASETSTVQEAWATDPDVVGVNDTWVGVVTVGESSITVFSYTPVGGRSLPVVTLSGRMPVGPDEIALAPDSVRNTGAKIGDIVTAGGREDTEVRLRVTGIVFVPENPHNRYADGGWLTGEGFHRLFPGGFFKYHETHVALRSDADVAAVTDRLSASMVEAAGAPVMEFGPPFFVPSEVTQIRDVRAVPLALGVFLGLLAVGACGHALATAVRRRQHDMAVLCALGITRWQSRLVVVTQAMTLAVVGLLFGVPLGVALGRTVWRAVADFTPLQYVPPVAALALALVVPVALALGNVLAALPARRAARIRVGETLRAE